LKKLNENLFCDDGKQRRSDKTLPTVDKKREDLSQQSVDFNYFSITGRVASSDEHHRTQHESKAVFDSISTKHKLAPATI
jgi:hypothetical protein